MGPGEYTTLQWPIKEDYEFWSCNDPIEHWLTKSNINYCIVNAKDDSEQIFFLLPSEVIIWYVTAFWIVKVQSLQVFTFLPFNSKFSKPCQSSLLWQLWYDPGELFPAGDHGLLLQSSANIKHMLDSI